MCTALWRTRGDAQELHNKYESEPGIYHDVATTARRSRVRSFKQKPGAYSNRIMLPAEHPSSGSRHFNALQIVLYE